MGIFSGWGLLFLVVALAFSCLHAFWYAPIFFEADAVKAAKAKHVTWKIHQSWLNLLGSAVGWLALWALVPHILKCLGAACSPEFTWSEVGLSFLAFLGVTGYVPYAVVGLARSLYKVGDFLKPG